MRWAARRDANDGVIGEALRTAGFAVHDFAKAGSGVPDRLVTRLLPDNTPWICWVEIKTEKGRLRPGQQEFQTVFEPRGEFYVARDAEQTVRDLMERYYASIKQELLR